MPDIIGWSSGNPLDPKDGAEWEGVAKAALKVLVTHYPGYSWNVGIDGGIMKIINYTLDFRGRYCMVLKLKDLQGHTYKRFEVSVRNAAGEFLERAHLVRSANTNADEATLLEGTPTKGAKRWIAKPKVIH